MRKLVLYESDFNFISDLTCPDRRLILISSNSALLGTAVSYFHFFFAFVS